MELLPTHAFSTLVTHLEAHGASGFLLVRVALPYVPPSLSICTPFLLFKPGKVITILDSQTKQILTSSQKYFKLLGSSGWSWLEQKVLQYLNAFLSSSEVARHGEIYKSEMTTKLASSELSLGKLLALSSYFCAGIFIIL